MKEPQWTIGVEEEYLLVDQGTNQLIQGDTAHLLKEAADALEGRARPEFLQAQLEIGSRVCANIAELRADLSQVRKVVIDLADRHRMGVMAASTHPFARWQEQQITLGERYQELAADFQTVMHRLLICGMHVHVGVDDRDLRVDLLNQISYFLPHLLALSCSSPFWEGGSTGLHSYRIAVFHAAPRTGLPSYFTSWNEYQSHVDVLVDAGIIEDASKIWWHARPSVRYPTVELRIPDLTTSLEDTLCLAALYVTLMRMLWRLRVENKSWRLYEHFLIEENVWRAQRYGTGDQLLDLGKETLVDFQELMEEILEMVRPDAEALDCVAEVEHARTILRRGTSAQRQLDAYERAVQAGKTHEEALIEVVKWVRGETGAGLDG